MIGPLPYIGGKRAIANKIIALFPKHTTYVEPFAGGAQVFFHKRGVASVYAFPDCQPQMA